jgi:hypothetical protein
MFLTIQANRMSILLLYHKWRCNLCSCCIVNIPGWAAVGPSTMLRALLLHMQKFEHDPEYQEGFYHDSLMKHVVPCIQYDVDRTTCSSGGTSHTATLEPLNVQVRNHKLVQDPSGL